MWKFLAEHISFKKPLTVCTQKWNGTEVKRGEQTKNRWVIDFSHVFQQGRAALTTEQPALYRKMSYPLKKCLNQSHWSRDEWLTHLSIKVIDALVWPVGVVVKKQGGPGTIDAESKAQSCSLRCYIFYLFMYLFGCQWKRSGGVGLCGAMKAQWALIGFISGTVQSNRHWSTEAFPPTHTINKWRSKSITVLFYDMTQSNLSQAFMIKCHWREYVCVCPSTGVHDTMCLHVHKCSLCSAQFKCIRH